MQFVGTVVKQAQKLDRSFTSPAHFLRLAYSINEKTGLVSLPIRLEEFDNFFWQEAKIEEVKVIDDWWGMVPADAQERMSKFLQFALRQKQFTAKKRKEVAKQFRKIDVKPKIDPQKEIIALRQLAQSLTDHQLYDSMLESAGEDLRKYQDKLGQKNIMTAIEHLKETAENQAIISLQEQALRHGAELNDLWLVWRWELRKHDLEYYAKAEIQESMYHEAENRKIQVGSDGPFVKLRSPQDIYWLAIFLHSHLGGNEHPAFYCSVAKYDVQDRFMIDYDIILETDGKGNHQKSVELMKSVVSVLQELDLTFNLRCTGSINLQAVIPTPPHIDQTKNEATQPQQSVLVESIKKQLSTTMREPELVKIFKHDELILLTHSLNEFTGKPCAPVTI